MNPLAFMNTNWNLVLFVFFFFLMNPLASMNEGSLFSNTNTTSFMGKEIELLKYNFSGEDYRNIEVTATKSLKIVYSTIP